MKVINSHFCESLTSFGAKKIVLSGPSGFLGSRVLEQLLQAHTIRTSSGVAAGEIVLLSSSPGRLMERLYRKYGPTKMHTVRASRVDYYTQHDHQTWKDQLGSLGLEGEDCVFVNLAAVAGPKPGIPDAMMDVNYHAARAAAVACQQLQFGHWIQSSTQATNAERGGQVPYSRAKAMIDFSLRQLAGGPMAVTIACLGLLYSKAGSIGQEKAAGLNLIDIALLPLTPIMGCGSAPLQPQEVDDAAERIVFLALSDPALRPVQNTTPPNGKCRTKFDSGLDVAAEGERDSAEEQHRAGYVALSAIKLPKSNYRFYDAVGPETMTMLEMLHQFAICHGNNRFTPVHIGYRNMEKIVNIKSLGNLNRQFVSLLRSEQDSAAPIIGDPSVWEDLTFEPGTRKLVRLEQAFEANLAKGGPNKYRRARRFPFGLTAQWVWRNPRVVLPGLALSIEIIQSYLASLWSRRGKGGRRRSLP